MFFTAHMTYNGINFQTFGLFKVHHLHLHVRNHCHNNNISFPLYFTGRQFNILESVITIFFYS